MAQKVVEDIENVAQALQNAARNVQEPTKTELRGLRKRLIDIANALFDERENPPNESHEKNALMQPASESSCSDLPG